MSYGETLPNKRPESGFYYHYKHDPNGPLNNYAYYIAGVGIHTEDDCREEDQFMQVYQALYDSFAAKNKLFDLRPLSMAMEQIEHNGKLVDRFTKITDPRVIEELKKIKKQMYGE